jgi:hypothetical protein
VAELMGPPGARSGSRHAGRRPSQSQYPLHPPPASHCRRSVHRCHATTGRDQPFRPDHSRLDVERSRWMLAPGTAITPAGCAA